MSKASDNLRTDQEQLDEEGIYVKVSRQALDEVLGEVEALQKENRDLKEGWAFADWNKTIKAMDKKVDALADFVNAQKEEVRNLRAEASKRKKRSAALAMRVVELKDEILFVREYLAKIAPQDFRATSWQLKKIMQMDFSLPDNAEESVRAIEAPIYSEAIKIGIFKCSCENREVRDCPACIFWTKSQAANQRPCSHLDKGFCDECKAICAFADSQANQ